MGTNKGYLLNRTYLIAWACVKCTYEFSCKGRCKQLLQQTVTAIADDLLGSEVKIPHHVEGNQNARGRLVLSSKCPPIHVPVTAHFFRCVTQFERTIKSSQQKRDPLGFVSPGALDNPLQFYLLSLQIPMHQFSDMAVTKSCRGVASSLTPVQ